MIILPYAVAIGTIDSGKTGILHKIGAVTFFVSLLAVVVFITFRLWQMRNWDPSIISTESWILKRLTCGYLVLVWLYCIVEITVLNRA